MEWYCLVILTDLQTREIWHTRSTDGRNHVHQIFSQSVHGLQSSDTQNCHFPLTCCVTLTTMCATAVRHCDVMLWIKHKRV